MTTQCNETKLIFHDLDSHEVVGRFDGGEITSDAGAVLLREVEKRTRVLGRISECFADHRDPERIEHTVESLVKQRVMGLCLGYEDLNDHDELCRDRRGPRPHRAPVPHCAASAHRTATPPAASPGTCLRPAASPGSATPDAPPSGRTASTPPPPSLRIHLRLLVPVHPPGASRHHLQHEVRALRLLPQLVAQSRVLLPLRSPHHHEHIRRHHAAGLPSSSYTNMSPPTYTSDRFSKRVINSVSR